MQLHKEIGRFAQLAAPTVVGSILQTSLWPICLAPHLIFRKRTSRCITCHVSLSKASEAPEYVSLTVQTHTWGGTGHYGDPWSMVCRQSSGPCSRRRL